MRISYIVLEVHETQYFNVCLINIISVGLLEQQSLGKMLK